mgnify:CR=1 FL=1
MSYKGSWLSFIEGTFLVIVASGIMGLNFAVRALREFVYHPFFLFLSVPFVLFSLIGPLACDLARGLIIYFISLSKPHQFI